MVILGLADVPIYFLNTLNDFGVLLFARGPMPLRPSLDLSETQWSCSISTCITMGWSSIQSFGAAAAAVWFCLPGADFAGVLLPQYVDLVGYVTFPLELGEIAIVLWLIVMGAKGRARACRITVGPAPELRAGNDPDRARRDDDNCNQRDQTLNDH